ncbi:MAG TPA: TIGR03667 family PPOX class F420-dependent oxidoreductase [Nitrolancea sp.]|jgi:PPOX class probable F420-dependent enzyme|nr:TIGR03667 family PPOX class F420-dependent oxidoreductase [Nitrolancea sp.]
MAERMLQEEEIIWLTTVSPNGQPESVPIWFYWDGTTVLIYSQPGKPKLRNIEANPRVALNFNSDPQGSHIVRMQGRAVIDQSTPPANDMPGMIEKYKDAIKRLGTTPAQFAEGYSVAIRVTPTRVTAF